MSSLAKLNELRSYGGAIRTRGLDDATMRMRSSANSKVSSTIC